MAKPSYTPVAQVKEETAHAQAQAQAQNAYLPSPQQQAVIDWALYDTGNLNLIARAGCGKTSTLKMLVNRLANEPSNTQGIFLCAFNKAIAEEIKSWLSGTGIPPFRADAGTMHSIGYRAWRKIAPRACQSVNSRKVGDIFDKMYPVAGTRVWKLDDYGMEVEVELQQDDPARVYRQFVVKVVSLAKQCGFGISTSIRNRPAWLELVDHFGVDDDLEELLSAEFGVEYAIGVYERSLELCREEIDFDDMILAPLYFKAKFQQYSWVLIDEAQDTNEIRRELALRILAPGGRLVAVGDPAQAIYGFTGADADAMDLIRDALGSSELPLNMTYRCPKKVVALAQNWVKDIYAADTAPEGTVKTIVAKEFWKLEFGRTDAILCRNTAPLVDLAYQMLRRGIACKVEGREIGQGLISLANRFKVKTLDAMMRQLEEWRDKEIKKYQEKRKENKAAQVQDKCDTVLFLADVMLEQGKQMVSDLVSFINGMFADTAEYGQKCLLLATVHKSKGREWDRVFLLGRNAFMPSKWANKLWQIEQEDNLCYVAVTRAKKELIEIWVEKESKESKSNGRDTNTSKEPA